MDKFVYQPGLRIRIFMDTQETTILTALLISVPIIGIIIIIFIISIIRHQRRNLELQRLNILAEITTLETERARMSADLHDEMGPVLSAIKFRINAVDSANEEDLAQLQQAGNQIDEVIDRMRTIARDLLPSSLTRKGLVVAIREYISVISSALPVQFQSDVKTLTPEWSLNIYRIIQEIVNNAIKHAKASRMVISLKEKENRLELICEDDGVGLDYFRISTESNGLGLRNIKSRVEIMGGTMQVSSPGEKGTQFYISLPLPNTYASTN